MTRKLANSKKSWSKCVATHLCGVSVYYEYTPVDSGRGFSIQRISGDKNNAATLFVSFLKTFEKKVPGFNTSANQPPLEILINTP